jgi:hypothetical protein
MTWTQWSCRRGGRAPQAAEPSSKAQEALCEPGADDDEQLDIRMSLYINLKQKEQSKVGRQLVMGDVLQLCCYSTSFSVHMQLNGAATPDVPDCEHEVNWEQINGAVPIKYQCIQITMTDYEVVHWSCLEAEKKYQAPRPNCIQTRSTGQRSTYNKLEPSDQYFNRLIHPNNSRKIEVHV